jgi:phosphoglycerate dehydrogenase-like enzyme
MHNEWTTMHAHLNFTPADLATLTDQLDDGITLTTGGDPPPETVVFVAGRPTREQILACQDLRALVIPFAGLPAATQALMRDFPQIAIHNLHHNSSITAEMAITLLMAVARQIIPAHNTFVTHDWTPRFEGPRGIGLRGRTALILGYGAIGERVGRVCEALEMRVWGVRRRPDPRPNVIALDQLDALLPEADALICCLPGTPATEGVIDAARLARLPQGALIVNVGRAAVIDEEALYQALADGHLGGAGLDVWYDYPRTEQRTNHPPSRFPFHTLPNVVMSPHRAGGLGTESVEVGRAEGIAAALNAAKRGEPIPHPVDLDAGY